MGGGVVRWWGGQGEVDRWLGGCVVGWKGRWVDKWLHGCVVGWMGGEVDGWWGGQLVGWMGGG